MRLVILFLILMVPVAQGNEKIKVRIAEVIAQEKYDEAYVLIIGEIKNGDRELQHLLAMLVSNGYGTIKKEERNQFILELLKKSARQGFPDSRSWLADAYENGWFGLDKSMEKARCWRSIKNEENDKN